MLNNLTKSLLSHKQFLINLSNVAMVIWFLFVMITFYMPSFDNDWLSLSHLAANGNIVMLALSLIPGILRRWRASGSWQQIQVALMAFRRQTGQWMCLLGASHWLWQKIFPALKYSLSPIASDPMQGMGMISLLLATPLMLTSNDWSVKKLAKTWGKLHKLAYLILLGLLVHVLLMTQLKKTLFILVFVLIGEVTSWLRFWQNQRNLSQSQTKLD